MPRKKDPDKLPVPLPAPKKTRAVPPPDPDDGREDEPRIAEFAWEQREGEKEVAYQAFLNYRNQTGRRSLRRVAQSLDKSLTLIGEWSAEHEWVARVFAWDKSEQQRVDAERQQLQREIMDEELADVRLLKRRFDEMLNQTKLHVREAVIELNGEKVQPVKLNIADWRDLIRMRRELGDQFRRAVGLPEKVTQTQVTGKDDGPVEVAASHRFDVDEMADLFRQMGEFERGQRDEPAP